MRDRVALLRGRMVRLALAEGALWVVLAAALPLALLMGVDAQVDLPRNVRAAAWFVIGAIVLVVLARQVLHPLRRIPSSDALALRVERRAPILRSRLISALQLGRERLDHPVAEGFVRRLVVEARDATEAVDPRLVAPADSLRRQSRRVFPALGVLALLFAVTWPTSGILLRRAFLEEIPVPRRTRLVEVTGPRTIGRGDDVSLAAVVEGVVPASGTVWIRHASGRVQRLPVDADPARRGRFERVVANVPTGFRYRLKVNDAESEEFEVRVLPRPVATNLVVLQELPAYTGLAPRQLEPTQLSLLEGSRIVLRGRADQPLKAATVRLGGLEEVLPARLNAADPAAFEASIDVLDPRLNSLSVDLVDLQGIPSRDPAVYPIEVVPDRPPQVRVTAPVRREELSTPRGTVLVAFEATDDLGLAGLRLRYEQPGTNAAPAGMIELDLEDGVGSEVRRRFEWSLGSLTPEVAQGQFLEFWVEALDRRDKPGPGVGRSEKYLVRVVSEAEKRADLLARASDAIGKLGDVAQGQERLNDSLGRIILARPSAEERRTP